jgi:hypothetical protein
MTDTISLVVAIVAVVIALFSWNESRAHGVHFQSMARSLAILAADGEDDSTLGHVSPSPSESRHAWRQAPDNLESYQRPELHPWVGWVSWSLLGAFVLYAIYFAAYVFPTSLLLTEPILGWIFFGLIFANGGWAALLVLVGDVEDLEERRFILAQIDELRRSRAQERPKPDRRPPPGG